MIWDAILITHVVAGTLALISGTMVTLITKGTRLHRKLGVVFTGNMLAVGLSALTLCLIKPNDFLMAIGLFTLYMTFSGWVRMRFQSSVKTLIRISGFSGCVFSGILIFNAFETGVNIVLLVFAGIQLAMSVEDLFTNPETNKLRKHISRMSGAYIASLTAFLVVNVTFLPGIVVWLGPTVVGSFFIAASIRKYTVPNRNNTADTL